MNKYIYFCLYESRWIQLHLYIMTSSLASVHIEGANLDHKPCLSNVLIRITQVCITMFINNSNNIYKYYYFTECFLPVSAVHGNMDHRPANQLLLIWKLCLRLFCPLLFSTYYSKDSFCSFLVKCCWFSEGYTETLHTPTVKLSCEIMLSDLLVLWPQYVSQMHNKSKPTRCMLYINGQYTLINKQIRVKFHWNAPEQNDIFKWWTALISFQPRWNAHSWRRAAAASQDANSVLQYCSKEVKPA